MRYLVRARVKPGREAALLRAIDEGTLGRGSVAGGEYLRNMRDARLCDDGTAHWVEACFCALPLAVPRGKQPARQGLMDDRLASATSASTIRPPRAVLISSAPRFISAMELRLMNARVRGVRCV
jgi:hypothetical protein